MSRITRWLYGVSPGLTAGASHLLRTMCTYCRPEDGLVMDPENPDRVLDQAFYAQVCNNSPRSTIRYIQELTGGGYIRDSGGRRGITGKVPVYRVTGADYGWDPQAFLEAQQGKASLARPIEAFPGTCSLPVADAPPLPPWPAVPVSVDRQADNFFVTGGCTGECRTWEDELADDADSPVGADQGNAELEPKFRQMPAGGELVRRQAEERLSALAHGYAGLTSPGGPQLDHYLLAMEDLLALGVVRETAMAVTLDASAQFLQAAGDEWLRSNGSCQRRSFLQKVLRFMVYTEGSAEIESDDVDQAGFIFNMICEGLECDKFALGRPLYHIELAVLGLLALGFDIDTAVLAARSRICARLQVVAAAWEEAHPGHETGVHRNCAHSRLEWAGDSHLRYPSGLTGPE